MKVWRQALSVQRVPTTLNAQPLQTLNLPIMAAQPQSLKPRSGAVIRSASEVIRHASSVMRHAKRSTSPWRPRRDFPLMTDDPGPCGPCMKAACGG
ncbi:MAG: hypothetical protein M0Q87_09445 [Ottowia sp.]|nr:hypothetical protein [Ottowia sp.]